MNMPLCAPSRFISLVSFGCLALVVALSACDGCVSTLPSPDLGEGEGEGEQPGGGGEGEGEGEPGATLVIDPADPVLDATVGGSETLLLKAFLVDAVGNRVLASDAFWLSLAPQIGTVDASGLFIPSRERAGIARVRCRAGGMEQTTLVRVNLHDVESDGSDVTLADFDGAVGPVPLPLLYPEDGVVIPANLAPMVVQWDKVHSRARVQLVGDYGSLALLTAGNQARASTAAWRRFLLGNLGGAITLSVDETDGPGQERAQRSITVHVAAADLTSTVYYWAVNRGAIVRIDADSETPIDMNIPAQGDDNGCRACHALSANGQRMSFTYAGGNGPGGVVDTNGTSVLLNDDARRWNFSAINPDGSLLVTTLSNRLTFRDGNTGLAVPGFEDLGVQGSHPAFSPTGTRIAFANNVLQNGEVPEWEIDFNSSDIAVADVDPALRTVTGIRRLVPGNGRALTAPSFTPDGRLVAYGDGTASRSGAPNDLMLAAADDTRTEAPHVKLVRANPAQSAYNPTFNPKVEGGYIWIAFFSRRDYGHHIRGVGRPQIWVAAVDASADPSTGIDPSHPAFWLPGQAEEDSNLSSFFAPKPCSETGGLCESDAACCGDGLCRPVDGVAQCVPPDGACLLTGDACATDGECCAGLNCAFDPDAGYRACLVPGTVCSAGGQLCQLDADCCAGAGLCVDDGSGTATTRCLSGSCAATGEACTAGRACCSGADVCSVDGICSNIGG